MKGILIYTKKLYLAIAKLKSYKKVSYNYASKLGSRMNLALFSKISSHCLEMVLSL